MRSGRLGFVREVRERARELVERAPRLPRTVQEHRRVRFLFEIEPPNPRGMRMPFTSGMEFGEKGGRDR